MFNLKVNSFTNILVIIFIVALVLVPPIKVPFFSFKIQIVDFLMPVFAGLLIYNKWYKNWKLLYVKNFLFLIGIIVLSILINKQWWAINDWFEIYKVIKYGLVFLIFKEYFPTKINTKIVDIVFICLLLINFLHYHNLLNFNQIIMPLYCGENSVHLKFFGLNSIGFPAVKRMLGTMGNPNNNAILFLIFMLFYLPKEKWKTKNICFFVLCLIAFLACQSRTSLVAFFVIIVVNFIIIRVKWQKVIIYSSVITVVICSFFLIDMSTTFHTASPVIDASSYYSLTLLDGTAFNSGSWNFRIELWKHFLNQIVTKPVLGHAPQKNFFYQQKLFFENEYILFLWRYGILGFVSFIGFYLFPLKTIIKNVKSNDIYRNTLLLIIIFATCGLTNTPLTNTTLSLLFFSYLGIFYAQKNDEILNKYENLAQNH
jgi:O-antigen ligase